MADKIPLKANLTGGAATSLGEFATGDTVPVANGGTGVTSMAALLTALGLDDKLHATGDFKQAMRASAPSGWIAASSGTIGNVGSGATRANVDTLALFTLWWTDFSDALCPILTSAGGASTRGASAAADWAALKRLTVFDASGRFPRVPGTINSVTIAAGTKYADTVKDHRHGVAVIVGNNSGPTVTNLAPGTGWTVDSPSNTGLISTTGMTAATETAGASIAIPGFWKL